MKLNYIITFLAVLITSPMFAQQNGPNLSIGDHFPEFVIPKIINSAKKTDNTAGYKNKLLIVDFWATTCLSCMEHMPKMEVLQKKYISSVKILPVTTEKEDFIRSFWKNNKYLRGVSLPSVVEDKIFNDYFKHIYSGLYAWIYKGTVVGITSVDYVDEYNIKRVLNGEHVNWPVVNDFLKYDMKTPLFSIDSRQVNPNSPIEYAIISGARKNANSYLGVSRDTLKKTIRSFAVNSSILNVYFNNFFSIVPSDSLIKPSRDFQANQVLWHVKDTTKYTFIKREGEYLSSWKLKNGICYESICADRGQNDKDIHRSVISDLNRLMGLNVRWEKMKRKVWVVTKGDRIANRKGKEELSGEKYSIYELINKLNEQSGNPYVFNESGDEESLISFKIDLLNNVSIARNILENYGFKMNEEEREVHMLIFDEVDGPWFPMNRKQMDSIFKTDTQKLN